MLPATQGSVWESLEEFASEEDRLQWQRADAQSNLQQSSLLLTVAHSSQYPQQSVTLGNFTLPVWVVYTQQKGRETHFQIQENVTNTPEISRGLRGRCNT